MLRYSKTLKTEVMNKKTENRITYFGLFIAFLVVTFALMVLNQIIQNI